MEPSILKICETVRDKQLRRLGDVDGACREVALGVAYEALQKGYDICVAVGTYDGQDHYWLRKDSVIYDPTASQYGASCEVAVLNEDDAKRYSEQWHMFFSAGRLKPLLS